MHGDHALECVYQRATTAAHGGRRRVDDLVGRGVADTAVGDEWLDQPPTRELSGHPLSVFSPDGLPDLVPLSPVDPEQQVVDSGGVPDQHKFVARLRRDRRRGRGGRPDGR